MKVEKVRSKVEILEDKLRIWETLNEPMGVFITAFFWLRQSQIETFNPKYVSLAKMNYGRTCLAFDILSKVSKEGWELLKALDKELAECEERSLSQH